MNNIGPSFLIIGSMKSGTTILNEFINSHADVVGSNQKEIHYFSLMYHLGLDWYLGHFTPEPNKIFGDASPTYFDIAYTQAIPEAIKAMNPMIRLILVVRDPVERAISHYSHLCRINKVDALINMDINKFFSHSFSDALKQTTAIDYYLNQILSFSCYYRKYLIYKQFFHPEQILVLSNNELISSPNNTMNKVFNHLSLEPFESESFNQFKYSTGSNRNMLTNENKQKLEEYLYPDFNFFCQASGLNYSAVINK